MYPFKQELPLIKVQQQVEQAALWVCREYKEGMEELEPISVLDVVMALQRQGAIGQFRNSRSACIPSDSAASPAFLKASLSKLQCAFVKSAVPQLPVMHLYTA